MGVLGHGVGVAGGARSGTMLGAVSGAGQTQGWVIKRGREGTGRGKRDADHDVGGKR